MKANDHVVWWWTYHPRSETTNLAPLNIKSSKSLCRDESDNDGYELEPKILLYKDDFYLPEFFEAKKLLEDLDWISVKLEQISKPNEELCLNQTDWLVTDLSKSLNNDFISIVKRKRRAIAFEASTTITEPKQKDDDHKMQDDTKIITTKKRSLKDRQKELDLLKEKTKKNAKSSSSSSSDDSSSSESSNSNNHPSQPKPKITPSKPSKLVISTQKPVSYLKHSTKPLRPLSHPPISHKTKPYLNQFNLIPKSKLTESQKSQIITSHLSKTTPNHRPLIKGVKLTPVPAPSSSYITLTNSLWESIIINLTAYKPVPAESLHMYAGRSVVIRGVVLKQWQPTVMDFICTVVQVYEGKVQVKIRDDFVDVVVGISDDEDREILDIEFTWVNQVWALKEIVDSVSETAKETVKDIVTDTVKETEVEIKKETEKKGSNVIFIPGQAKKNEDKEEAVRKFLESKRRTMLKMVRRQMEFYFGDKNYNTDKYLNEQAKKSEEGYVPLDIILTFNKIKNIGADKKLIIEAIEGSEIWQLNDDKTEVKKKN